MKKLLVLLFSIALSHQSVANETQSNFEVTETNGIFRVLTHGEVIWGHQFGLVLMPDNCDSNMLWLSISSYEDHVETLKGKTIDFTWMVDDEAIDLSLDVSHVFRATPTFQIVLFNSIAFNEQFIRLLRSSSKLKTEIVGPQSEISKFDFTEESFSLEGFGEKFAAAKQRCTLR